MTELLSNHTLWAAVAAMGVAQLFKVVLILITERRFAPDRLLETGGMPSSHSAAVTALTTGLGLSEGWNSPHFALAAIFGSIVIYDATGIRRAAGMQAELINELVKELSDVFQEGFQPTALKTLLGHTYPQVAAGALLGVVTGFLVFT